MRQIIYLQILKANDPVANTFVVLKYFIKILTYYKNKNKALK